MAQALRRWPGEQKLQAKIQAQVALDAAAWLWMAIEGSVVLLVPVADHRVDPCEAVEVSPMFLLPLSPVGDLLFEPLLLSPEPVEDLLRPRFAPGCSSEVRLEVLPFFGVEEPADASELA